MNSRVKPPCYRHVTRKRTVALVTALALAVLAAIGFGGGSDRIRQLSHPARELWAPHAGSVRPWMTIEYAAESHGVPAAKLAERLDVPPELAGRMTLRRLAGERDRPRSEMIRATRVAIADLRGQEADSAVEQAWNGAAEWLGSLGDRTLETVLLYGYPALALILFGAAAGLPLPSGLAVGLAGSLIAQDSLTWLPTVATVTLATSLGDLLGYTAGRLLGYDRLGRHGRWLGLTAHRLARARSFVDRWGLAGLFVSRTVLSALGPAVNLLVGANRLSLPTFLASNLAGRGVWAAAYLMLGYSFGNSTEVMDVLTENLSLVVAGLAGVGAATYALYRVGRWARRAGLLDPPRLVPDAPSPAPLMDALGWLRRSSVGQTGTGYLKTLTLGVQA